MCENSGDVLDGDVKHGMDLTLERYRDGTVEFLEIFIFGMILALERRRIGMISILEIVCF